MNWFSRRPHIDAENVIGNFVGGDVHGTLIQQFIQGAPPNEPSLPWRELPTEFDPFRFLSWRTRLAPIVGRDAALDSLAEWAQRSGAVKVRLLTGGGGAGKSRLAAEVAARLRDKKWSAGFVALDKPAILPVPKEGLLWIVDYPEENRTATRQFLSALAQLEEPAAKIRLLLLSRRSVDWWQSDIDAAHAADICDTQATKIANLSEDETVTLYRLSYDRVIEHLGLKRADFDEQAIRSWRARQPELHGLPLITMAAAIHSAVEGNAFPSLEGGEIVQALVRRERFRMDNLGRNAGFGNAGLSRIIGLAAIPGIFLPDDLRHFADTKLEMGIPGAERIIDSLSGAPWWESQSLPGLTPDVLAAELLLEILSDRPDKAGVWLCAAIERSSAQWVSRVERLAYDVKRVRGPKENRISEWLAEIGDMPEPPFDKLQPVLLEPSHRATLRLAVRVAKFFANNTEGDEQARTTWLQNGSHILARANDRQGALAMIEQAVNVNRKLAGDGSSESLLRLASSLNSYSNRLSEAGHWKKAVNASRKAIEIFSKALAEDLASDEKALDLANALNNYAAHTAAVGEVSESVESIESAVQLYRQIGKAGRRNIEPELANALHNLGQLLPEEALTPKREAVEEAIGILERLAEENPVRFEPQLAGFLKTLSNLKSQAGDEAGARQAAEQGLRVLERLAIEEPGRFDSDLAIAYETFSFRLSAQSERTAAVEASEKAVAIWRLMAEQNPGRSLPDLARSLDHLSNHARGEQAGKALAANEEAVTCWRKAAAEYPQRFEPDLARSLNNLSNLRGATGDREGGYAAAKEAHEVIRPLAEKDPDRFNYELASVLMTLHNRLVEMENGWPFAMMAISEAVDILRKLAVKNQKSFDGDLAKALVRFGSLLDATGDPRRDAVLQEAGDILKRIVDRENGAAA